MSSDFISQQPDGKSQINKSKAFCFLLNNSLPESEKSFNELFHTMDEQILQYDNRIKTGALSNVHGDWYEWLLAISSWNLFANREVSSLAMLLPNVKQFDVAQLYQSNMADLIIDLRQKVAQSSDVELISSNPDFVFIDGSLARSIVPKSSRIIDVHLESITFLNELYKNFTHKCSFDHILGYISVKNTLRPDRRLQIAHEGSLMKALYVHLQTRQWILNPKGLKYYAISTSVSEADRNALKTVATHSITTVNSLPQAAVDDVFTVNSLGDAARALSSILS